MASELSKARLAESVTAGRRMVVTKKIEGLLRLPDVLAIFPVGRTTWYEGIKAGRYPKPLKIGPRATAWRIGDIEKLISDSPFVESGEDRY